MERARGNHPKTDRVNDVTEEEIRNMGYYERTEILNSNPVLLARHFQYRVETFFKEIVLSGLIGKVKHYAIRVEFQVRGSPHIHCLIWVEDAPKLESFNGSPVHKLYREKTRS